MEYTQPKVLIVILNYITYAMTINLIKELLTDLDYENYSIMVVDNCSPNESAEILEQKSKEMGYILDTRLEIILGFATELTMVSATHGFLIMMFC